MSGNIDLKLPARVQISSCIDWAMACASVINHQCCYHPHGTQMGTIGLPLYLAETDGQYFKAASSNNGKIWREFKILLEPMMELLEAALRLPIIYHPRLALPGFHIFRSSKIHRYTGGVWHTDIFRYSVLPHPIATYSATLLLGDQCADYGIDYMVGDCLERFEHRIGFVTIFRSGMPHRVSEICAASPAQTRVTLQAHVWVYPQHAIAFW